MPIFAALDDVVGQVDGLLARPQNIQHRRVLWGAIGVKAFGIGGSIPPWRLTQR